VPALRNVHRHLAPGGTLCMVVWRRRLDNEWLHRAQRVVEQLVRAPDETDQVTCGPGPFSQADANVVTDQLLAAGFRQVALERHDTDIEIGRDVDEAVQFACSLGPAGEATPDGVWASSSTWIITARA